MTDPDFPDALRSFIQEAIPTVDAAELLLALLRTPERPLELREILDSMGSAAPSESAARHYLTTFNTRGIVAAYGERYQYAPENSDIDAAVRALARVYNERPVTLVRTIYAPKDDKIRSFADAFRLKKK